MLFMFRIPASCRRAVADCKYRARSVLVFGVIPSLSNKSKMAFPRHSYQKKLEDLTSSLHAIAEFFEVAAIIKGEDVAEVGLYRLGININLAEGLAFEVIDRISRIGLDYFEVFA